MLLQEQGKCLVSRLCAEPHSVKMDHTSHQALEWISHAYWMSSPPCSGVLQWSFSADWNALAVLCEQMCPWPPPNAVWAIRSQILLYGVFWEPLLHLRAFHLWSAHAKMHFPAVLNRTKGEVEFAGPNRGNETTFKLMYVCIWSMSIHTGQLKQNKWNSFLWLSANLVSGLHWG